MPSLLEITDFGAIDAESDQLLDRCFEEHPAFRAVLEDRRFLVVGRKGSGKTAIFKKVLELNGPNFFAVGLNLADYPWHYHDAQIIPTVAEQERYLHRWRYLILMELAKLLLNKDQSYSWSEFAVEARDKLEQFVVDTYGTRDPDITQIFRPEIRLRHLQNLTVDLKLLKFSTVPNELSMKDLPQVFSDVNKSLQRLILGSLNPRNRYYICFDQLDIGFQPDSREYKQRLIGLILAARDFMVAAQEAQRNLRILIFLRSDIYHNVLLFEDKNKITDTYLIEIEWDRPGLGTTLKSLMERRFCEVLGIDRNGAWEAVFDETSEMPGHQTKYQYIIDRTFCRPRDIIKYCNTILEVFKERWHKGKTNSDKFQNKEVIVARSQYSEYLKREIVDEIQKYHPEFDLYFEILRQIGCQQFTIDKFEDAYKIWGSRLVEKKAPIDILEHLYEFSIIGFYKAGGKGYGGSQYIYKYRNQGIAFNRSAGRFRVHPGLVEVLDLKKYSRS